VGHLHDGRISLEIRENLVKTVGVCASERAFDAEETDGYLREGASGLAAQKETL
jgi:hypothetical protein